MLITNQLTDANTSAHSTPGATATGSSPSAANSASPAGGSGFEVLRGASSKSLLGATEHTPTPPPTTVKPNDALFGAIANAWHAALDFAKQQEQIDKTTRQVEDTIIRGIN
jgi:hypothetical protein